MNIRGTVVVLALALASAFACIPLHAQTPTVVAFTFDGGNGTLSACPNILTENGLPVEGTMCLNGSPYCGPGFGIDLETDLPPIMPNNGFMCGFFSTLSYGQQSWGARADGTRMDGTQAGDFYVLPASTVMPIENNDTSYWGNIPDVPVTVNLKLTLTYELGPVRVCVYRTCHVVQKLLASLTGGTGTLQFTEGTGTY